MSASVHREVPRRWLPDAVFGRREAAPHVAEEDLEGVPVDVALQRVVGRVVRREEEPPRHLGRAEAREEEAAAQKDEAGDKGNGRQDLRAVDGRPGVRWASLDAGKAVLVALQKGAIEEGEDGHGPQPEVGHLPLHHQPNEQHEEPEGPEVEVLRAAPLALRAAARPHLSRGPLCVGAQAEQELHETEAEATDESENDDEDDVELRDVLQRPLKVELQHERTQEGQVGGQDDGPDLDEDGPVDQRAVRVGAGLGPRCERAEEDAQLVERVEVRGEVILRLCVLVALGALADAPKEEAEHEEREDGVPEHHGHLERERLRALDVVAPKEGVRERRLARHLEDVEVHDESLEEDPQKQDRHSHPDRRQCLRVHKEPAPAELRARPRAPAAEPRDQLVLRLPQTRNPNRRRRVELLARGLQ
mmetsp:Transcript_8021/g.26506  ORF Transcript_8021/g.26506 Transcript_8021/m.26506 type:complete len:418 (+) Transcript_8021:245-1498(+)